MTSLSHDGCTTLGKRLGAQEAEESCHSFPKNLARFRRVTIRRHRAKWFEITADKALWFFIGFATIVFLMGGGSRYDITSVGPLRALTAIALAAAVWFQTRKSFELVRWPVLLLVALGIWMGMQLLPLPPSVWHQLHGRENIAQLDGLLGMGDVWRPLTLSPQRTWNALGSLIVPLASLLILALLNDEGYRKVRRFVIYAGVTSALLGIAQIGLRGVEGLYLYEITNSESAVGLFSNRNHNALLLNIALLFSLFERSTVRGSGMDSGAILRLSGQIILILAILINGSRFGLILLGLVGAGFAVSAIVKRKANSSKATGKDYFAVAGGAVAVVLVILFAFLDRIPAVNRLLGRGLDEGLRSTSFDYVVDLAKEYFPFGAGFGSFEQAYRQVEPLELLGPAYFNHAHNDWLQIVIEGGAPAVLLLVIGLALLLLRALQAWRIRGISARGYSMHFLGLFTLAMFALHSAADYPLRTPSLMVVATIALALVLRFPKEGAKATAT